MLNLSLAPSLSFICGCGSGLAESENHIFVVSKYRQVRGLPPGHVQ